MKTENILMILAVGAAVFVGARYLAGRTKGTGTGKNTGVVGPAYVTEVGRSDGWTYYSDGTAIGPNGTYYQYGQEVYNPAGMYAQ